jgi:hypothetical protein
MEKPPALIFRINIASHPRILCIYSLHSHCQENLKSHILIPCVLTKPAVKSILPIQIGLREGNALSSLLFSFSFSYITNKLKKRLWGDQSLYADTACFLCNNNWIFFLYYLDSLHVPKISIITDWMDHILHVCTYCTSLYMTQIVWLNSCG